MPDQDVPELQSLFEAPGLPRFDLPEAVERAYGGFGLPDRVVYGNFVSSLDGIVAIPGVPRSSALISGGGSGDRFVVALLRAAADAIVIGAGTFRAHEGPWTPENAHPEAAEAFVELRRTLGQGDRPTLVVVTNSGDLGGPSSKLDGVIVVTTSEGSSMLAENGGTGGEVVELGATGSVDMREAIRWLAEHGHRRILTEGGPKLMGEALKARVVDELFLTVSPLIVGGGEKQPRPTLATGVELLPDEPLSARLLSIHRCDIYLFLRYSLLGGTPSSETEGSTFDRHVEAGG
jgi:riboflavin biosynthesis pyrimidine reductase